MQERQQREREELEAALAAEAAAALAALPASPPPDSADGMFSRARCCCAIGFVHAFVVLCVGHLDVSLFFHPWAAGVIESMCWSCGGLP